MVRVFPLHLLKAALKSRRGPLIALLVGCNVFAGALLSGNFLANRYLYHDVEAVYSIFRNNFHSLNYFGEFRWWGDGIGFGFPAYYMSILGYNTLTPLSAVLGSFLWALGRMGVVVHDLTRIYIVYFGFLQPLVFSLGAFLLSVQIFRDARVLALIIVVTAFSPGTVFNLSDYSLEQSAYGLLFAAAFLNYYERWTRAGFLRMVLAAGAVAVSVNHLGLYWNAVFIPTFSLTLILVRRRAVSSHLLGALRGVPLFYWVLGLAVVAVALLPAGLTFSQGKDILRHAMQERVYPFFALQPGNPMELLAISTPGVGFGWHRDHFWLLPHFGPTHYAYVYMGILALPLVLVGLCCGRQEWRFRFFALIAGTTLAVLLSGYSAVFAPILVWPTPLRSVNHYSDTVFRSGLFFLLILAEALGFEAVLRSWRLRRWGLPVAFVLSTVLATIIIVAWFGERTFGDVFVGFGAALTILTGVVLTWNARAEANRLRGAGVVALLLLAGVDVATVSFMNVRRFMWRTDLQAHRDPPAGIVEMPNDRRSKLERWLLQPPRDFRLVASRLEGMAKYPSKQQAEEVAQAIGCAGAHPTKDGMWSPCSSPEKWLAMGFTCRDYPGCFILGNLPRLALYGRAQVLDLKDAMKFSAGETPAIVLGDRWRIQPEFGVFFSKGREKLGSPGKVEVVSRSYNSLEVRVDAKASGVLFWRDLYRKGWSVTVNGEEKEIARAFWLFKGVFVPAGTSTVLFRFSPPGLGISVVAAYAALLAVIGFLAFGGRTSQRGL